MDPDAFSASLFKWDPRGTMPPPPRFFDPVVPLAVPPPPNPYPIRASLLGGLDELFQAYGVRYFTASKIAELGFTVSTLLVMKEEEIDEMVSSLSQFYRWEILVGERYGIKAAVRAERRRVEEEEARRRHLSDAANALDALSQEGLSEDRAQQEREVVGSGGGVIWEVPRGSTKKKQTRKKGHSRTASLDDDDGTDNAGEDDEIIRGSDHQRQREHPFIVTEPGEVARGKKNGLDYLFHLYEQCREFLIQVQNLAKDRGEKCPTKVTNQVFRYAKKAGASYINKPKMRHYVHCYALHCLDEETSNALRRAYKERGENVGAWRQACYKPLVSIAARQGWDIDAIFNAHPRLTIWYVPTKLRQLCHAQHSGAACSSSIPGTHMVVFDSN